MGRTPSWLGNSLARPLHRALLTLAFLGAILFPTAAEATDRVGLITDAPTAALEVSFAGELKAAGFEVVIVPRSGVEPTWRTLRELTRHHELAASVLFSTDDGQLTIWVVDRLTGKMVVRGLPGPLPSTRDEAKIAALQGVELLRASLWELGQPAAEVAAEVEPSTAAQQLAEPPPAKYFAEFGGGVAGSAGGAPVTGQGWLAAQLMFHRRVGLRVGAMVPIVGARLSDREGYARISLAHVMAGPHVLLRRPAVVVRPDVGALFGVNILHFDGVASPPLRGRADRLVSFVARFGAGLSFRLSAAVRLRVEGAVGVSAPPLAVTFAGRRVGTWGLPFGTGTAALAIALR